MDVAGCSGIKKDVYKRGRKPRQPSGIFEGIINNLTETLNKKIIFILNVVIRLKVNQTLQQFSQKVIPVRAAAPHRLRAL